MRDNYKLINGFNVPTFLDEVNQAIADGWICSGGISVVNITETDDPENEGTGLFFSQALVKQ